MRTYGDAARRGLVLAVDETFFDERNRAYHLRQIEATRRPEPSVSDAGAAVQSALMIVVMIAMAAALMWLAYNG